MTSHRAAVSALRVGMAGTGGIAAAHLPAWLSLGVSVRLYSTDGTAEAVAAAHGAAVTVAESWRDLVTGADVIDVCTPSDTHADLVLSAIDAGCDVLCEKPLALTAADADMLVHRAHAAGRRLFPGHVVRYFPAYEALARAVADDDLGRIACARFTRTGAAPDWAAWFHDPARSGGIIIDQMIHDIDQAVSLFGEVVRVHARQSTSSDRDGTASAVATLEHRSGAISTVIGVWGPTGTPFRTTYEVTGTGGTIRHDSAESSGLVVRGAVAGGGEARGIPLGDSAETPFHREIDEFATAFAGGPAPRVTAADGAEAVRVAEACARSALDGREIVLSGVAVQEEGA
ncbi:Gfo/Idh/MocA family oxidoreductase [Microbacterium sp.]|uniref:Gfo/Idh/MocA family protein n=1 Tax=Microbacterium sp. TaxID=51671 RepID=UPI00333F4FC2